MQVFAHGVNTLWVLSSQVVPLTNIFGEVKQVDTTIFKAFDQFPVAGPYGRTRKATLVTVVRIVPVEVLAID